MKKVLCFAGALSVSISAFAGSIMSDYSKARVATASPVKTAVSTKDIVSSGTSRSSGHSVSGGYASAVSAYRQNQRNNYYINSIPDVDGICRTRITQCLTEYCGDVTALPGTTNSTCNGASYGQLYNWALLCLQRDTTPIVASYGAYGNYNRNMTSGATLCIPYVQQELSSYLAMSEVADNLSKSRSSECISARNELEAAITCHEVALNNGTQTTNKLTSELTSYCGEGVVSGGSALMVQKFVNAGNIGGNMWEWVDKAVSLDFNKKGTDWKEAVDAVLAGYINRMNLACGENFTMQDQARPKETSNLQTLAGLVLTGNADSFAPDNTGTSNAGLAMEVVSASPVYDQGTANQVVDAGLTKGNVFVQNAFLTSAQMQQMQDNFSKGTKVFILKDGVRCFTIIKGTLSDTEQRYLAQQYANCVSN